MCQEATVALSSLKLEQIRHHSRENIELVVLVNAYREMHKIDVVLRFFILIKVASVFLSFGLVDKFELKKRQWEDCPKWEREHRRSNNLTLGFLLVAYIEIPANICVITGLKSLYSPRLRPVFNRFLQFRLFVSRKAKQ